MANTTDAMRTMLSLVYYRQSLPARQSERADGTRCGRRLGAALGAGEAIYRLRRSAVPKKGALAKGAHHRCENTDDIEGI